MKKMLVLTLLFPALLSSAPLDGQKFYGDDPIAKEPPPLPLEKADKRKLNDFYDFFLNTFAKPGEKQPKRKKSAPAEFIPAQGINTLGEVPDSAWFTNRIGSRPMSIEELLQGPGNENAPSMEGPWTITWVKTEGITPGFGIQDSTGKNYLLKFDPMSNPEMTTGADVIGSAFFHALGYNVPQNYLVTFSEDKLVVNDDKGVTIDVKGRAQPLSRRDITEILLKVPRNAQGKLRGIASYYLEGKLLGGFRYHGTRSDDPNDIVPHEHRRDLRGLFVFCAWLGHDDSRSINTLDSLVEENGLRYIKHYLIDFGSILGSASVYANSARSGNAYLYEFKPSALQILTLGLYVPRWARARYRKWKPEYPNPAFENRLPDDTFWAAKKVMSFTDEQIEAMVKLAEYSDTEAEAWVTKCLIERRNKVGKIYFARVLPLDGFRLEGNRLAFEDLQVKYGFLDVRDYAVQWSRFDNESEEHTPLSGATSLTLPKQVQNAEIGSYAAITIQGEDAAKAVTVYLRKQSGGHKIVGVDRTW
jgi:hypothetical protein